MTATTDRERLARLRLARTNGVGAVTYSRLLQRYGNAVTAVGALLDAGKVVAPPEVAAEFSTAAGLGMHHLFVGDPGYPSLLAELADPPPLLLARGDTALAARPAIGIVGARNASAVGRGLARQMAAELAEAGFAVVSGLARGIDGAAHEGALPHATIACVAGGLDVAYPPEHAALQERIAHDGLLLSEQPPGVEPQARHFPRRNRLIAGVAQALVVIEAANGSGSLITARIATEAGRDVMAVPGHPSDPRSGGGNGLLKEGAILVENAADVIAALSPFQPLLQPQVQPTVPRRRQPVADPPTAWPHLSKPAGDFLDLLTVSGVAVDEIVRISGRPVAEVQALLSDLELEGRVVRIAGGRVALAA